MWIGSFKVNTALNVTFTLLLVTFILDIHFGYPIFKVIGGYVGILTAPAAWYTSAAGILNMTFQETVVPVNKS